MFRSMRALHARQLNGLFLMQRLGRLRVRQRGRYPKDEVRPHVSLPQRVRCCCQMNAAVRDLEPLFGNMYNMALILHNSQRRRRC
jgi:hypothetical protein